MTDPNGGRTHEPSLREITVELDGLRQLMDERDRRYAERFDSQQAAVAAALSAAEKFTASTANSAEKAISKQEAAQQQYNERTNEFRGQLSDQAAMLMPRAETESTFHRFREDLDRLRSEIGDLRISRSHVAGGQEKSKDSSDRIMAVIGIIVSLLTAGVVVIRLGG